MAEVQAGETRQWRLRSHHGRLTPWAFLFHGLASQSLHERWSQAQRTRQVKERDYGGEFTRRRLVPSPGLFP